MRLHAMKNDARPGGDRLISGKLRAKAARKGAENSVIHVDGTEYVWAYRHEWLVWGKGIKAVSVSVSLNPGRTRELILEFTVHVERDEGTPADAKVLRALEPAIRAAREAGWDPESRGRAFRYEVTERI